MLCEYYWYIERDIVYNYAVLSKQEKKVLENYRIDVETEYRKKYCERWRGNIRHLFVLFRVFVPICLIYFAIYRTGYLCDHLPDDVMFTRWSTDVVISRTLLYGFCVEKVQWEKVIEFYHLRCNICVSTNRFAYFNYIAMHL